MGYKIVIPVIAIVAVLFTSGLALDAFATHQLTNVDAGKSAILYTMTGNGGQGFQTGSFPNLEQTIHDNNGIIHGSSYNEFQQNAFAEFNVLVKALDNMSCILKEGTGYEGEQCWFVLLHLDIRRLSHDGVALDCSAFRSNDDEHPRGFNPNAHVWGAFDCNDSVVRLLLDYCRGGNEIYENGLGDDRCSGYPQDTAALEQALKIARCQLHPTVPCTNSFTVPAPGWHTSLGLPSIIDSFTVELHREKDPTRNLFAGYSFGGASTVMTATDPRNSDIIFDLLYLMDPVGPDDENITHPCGFLPGIIKSPRHGCYSRGTLTHDCGVDASRFPDQGCDVSNAPVRGFDSNIKYIHTVYQTRGFPPFDLFDEPIWHLLNFGETQQLLQFSDCGPDVFVKCHTKVPELPQTGPDGTDGNFEQQTTITIHTMNSKPKLYPNSDIPTINEGETIDIFGCDFKTKWDNSHGTDLTFNQVGSSPLVQIIDDQPTAYSFSCRLMVTLFVAKSFV